MALSWVLYLGVFLTPLTPLGTGEKVGVAGTLYVLSHVFFFGSTALLGRELVLRWKGKLRVWWGRRRAGGLE